MGKRLNSLMHDWLEKQERADAIVKRHSHGSFYLNKHESKQIEVARAAWENLVRASGGSK